MDDANDPNRHRGPPPFRIESADEREVWNSAYGAVLRAEDHRMRSPSKEAENAVRAWREVAPINMGTQLKPGSPLHVELWDAINELVLASGGCSNTRTSRQHAVVKVEQALASIIAMKPRT